MTTLNEFNRQTIQSSSGVPPGEMNEAPERYIGVAAGGRARLERQDALQRTIVREIIPRLMILNGLAAQPVRCGSTGATHIRLHDVSRLTELLLAGDDADIFAFVNEIMEGGASQSTVLLDLFAPAARRLGELWEDDTRTFAEVTLAMGSLQQSIRRMQAGSQNRLRAPNADEKTIVLAPGAGEQHWFAIQVLDDFFSRAGWRVVACPAFDRRHIGKVLATQHIEVLGLSISRDALLDGLSSDIDDFRAKSRNQSLRVLVGGRVFTGRPDLAKSFGADGSADDATAAVALAEKLIAHAPSIGV